MTTTDELILAGASSEIVAKSRELDDLTTRLTALEATVRDVPIFARSAAYLREHSEIEQRRYACAAELEELLEPTSVFLAAEEDRS